MIKLGSHEFLPDEYTYFGAVKYLNENREKTGIDPLSILQISPPLEQFPSRKLWSVTYFWDDTLKKCRRR